MPLFRYTLTYGPDTRTTELRRSNPQGWLPDAVHQTFPDVASHRASDLIRLRLTKIDDEDAWSAVLSGQPHDLTVQVVKTRA